jgi:hypothetical protein
MTPTQVPSEVLFESRKDGLHSSEKNKRNTTTKLSGKLIFEEKPKLTKS